MAVTQKQIAEKANVSPGLVAFALNGNGRVGEETRQRILRVAHDLGYYEHSNRAARALAARRHGSRVCQGALAVTFTAAEMTGTTWSHAPFFLPILSGIEQEARRRGIDVIACSPHPPAPRAVTERRVDGVIWLQYGFDWAHYCAELELPSVSVMHSDTPGIVGIADRDGTRQAVCHLHELGHRAIAYLGFSGNALVHAERLRGYLEGMAQCGLPVRKKLVEATLQSFDGAAAKLEKLLDRGSPFSGLVCYNDLVAMDAIRQLSARGLRVPQDVSVTGFDDVSIQHHFETSITSIAFDQVDLGRSAVNALYEMVDAWPLVPETARCILPVRLVERQSTQRCQLKQP